MYLRDLQICLSRVAVLPDGFSWESVHGPMFAVVEGFLAQLPRRKVKLGDAAKVCIMLGPRPPVGIFSHSDFGIYPDGVGWIWMSGFDFATLAVSNQTEQQRMFLDVVHNGLMEFARLTQSDPEPFIRANESLLAHPLPLPEFTREELMIRWGLAPKAKKAATSRKKETSKKKVTKKKSQTKKKTQP